MPLDIIICYIYGTMGFLALGLRRSYMAVPTSLALLCLAVALLLHAPDRGFMRTLTVPLQASRVLRFLLLALFIIPPLLGWVVLRLLGGGQQPPAFGVSATVMLCIVILAALA